MALGGDIYPALGGDYPGNFAFSSLQSLATNVKGVTVPLSGHWIPEEQPKFVVEQLLKLFEEQWVHLTKKRSLLFNSGKGITNTENIIAWLTSKPFL